MASCCLWMRLGSLRPPWLADGGNGKGNVSQFLEIGGSRHPGGDCSRDSLAKPEASEQAFTKRAVSGRGGDRAQLQSAAPFAILQFVLDCIHLRILGAHSRYRYALFAFRQKLRTEE